MRTLLSSLTLTTALLAACTGYSPGNLRSGASLDEVRQRMGEPTARYPLASGSTRLEFARGPFGKHTYMVDVDAGGRVQRIEQVLTEARFGVVAAGLPSEELLRQLGTPSQRRSGGWQGGEVWSYRYDATFCQWFQVSVVEGKVRDSAYAPDPMCDVNDRNDRST